MSAQTKITDPTGRFERKDEYITINESVIRYKAYDTQTGLEVTWHERLLSESAYRTHIDEILSYAELIRKLKHASMNSLVAFWHDQDTSRICYITESVSVSSVYQNIASGVVDVKCKVIARWFSPVLQVLHYLHSQRPPVVHGRLRLTSIYLKPSSGAVKLISPTVIPRSLFMSGLSVKIEPELPPEFLLGEIGPFSDIWSFGLAVLSVATKKQPYAECRCPAELVTRLRAYQPPECLREVGDPLLLDMVTRCLKPPEQRPSAADLLAHPFFGQNFDGGQTEKAAGNELVVIFSKDVK